MRLILIEVRSKVDLVLLSSLIVDQIKSTRAIQHFINLTFVRLSTTLQSF